MKILLLEDNESKASQIKDVAFSVTRFIEGEFVTVKDLVGARDALRQHHYDLLILDIRVPNLVGDDPIDDAGAEMLRELNASSTMLKPFHIIGISAFDDALEDANPIFEQELWCLIKYDASSVVWRSQLSAKIRYLVLSKKEAENPSNVPYDYDFAIVTALHKPELEAILDLDCGWIEIRIANDLTPYFSGLIKNEKKQVRVVAAAANQMGMAASAALSMKMINNFKPKILIMLGIAAGVPDCGLNYGDILVASQSWNYESGKKQVSAKGARFVPDPQFLPLAVGLKERFLRMEAKQMFVNDIQSKWRGQQNQTRLQMKVGPLASGSAVIADESVTESLKNQQRKIVGLDMETYGVFYAAANCPKPQPIPVSMKSVCDFADESKDDRFQTYAAYTSASFFREFALSELSEID